MSFGSKSKGLTFGFTKKCLFVMKTVRKSIFHPYETHILARLDIKMLYTIFFEVLKKIKFWLKT
jgi:hypothetical protein